MHVQSLVPHLVIPVVNVMWFVTNFTNLLPLQIRRLVLTG